MTELLIWNPPLLLNGPGWPPVTEHGPPQDSPLKVWDGSDWQPAGVKVED